MRARSFILLCLLAAGCAARPQANRSAATRPVEPPPTDPALLSLEQLGPAPALPAPATQPSSPPPLEALLLYAQARGYQLENDRVRAAERLRRALALDPDSFDLNLAMAMVQLASPGGAEQAMTCLQRAVELRPDSLDAQYLIGKQHLARGNAQAAIHHLRLATVSPEYRERAEAAALVDLYLARALERGGYDTAAIEQYARLLERLGSRLNPRVSPELFYVLTRPELVYAAAAELAQRRGRFAEALSWYSQAEERDPGRFELKAQMVRCLMGLGRLDEARDMAVELVTGQRAATASVELLGEVLKAQGRESDVVSELRRIAAQRKGDRVIGFALADLLLSRNNRDEAEAVLRDMARETRSDPVVVRRLLELYIERARIEPAAVLLIEALAQRPEAIVELEGLWLRLQRSPAGWRLRAQVVRELEVPPWAEAARQFFVAEAARLGGREILARSVLDEAARMRPPFAPAYLALLEDAFRRPHFDAQQRREAGMALAKRAAEAGAEALAALLRGLTELNSERPAEALAELDEALLLGDRSPGLLYARAMAMFQLGRGPAGEQALWAMLREHPDFENAYMTLFNRYLSSGETDQAVRVLRAWLSTRPPSVTARLIQATVLTQGSRLEDAESLLLSLLRDEPDNPAVVEALSQFYVRVSRVDQLLRHLEEQHARRPEGRIVANALVRAYASLRRTADALRAIERSRQAVASEPDQLYLVAHLYELVDRRQDTERVLQAVLELDASHAGANNDLGYMWADAGKNLELAEQMIRTAVEAEPDNSAYLDSLGWVLYKLGRYEEARRCLDEAARASDRPDPIILDHLGDVLYRLGRRGEAAGTWRLVLQRIEEDGTVDRDDLVKLRGQVQRKLEQHESGGAVDVAPVAEQPPSSQALR